MHNINDQLHFKKKPNQSQCGLTCATESQSSPGCSGRCFFEMKYGWTLWQQRLLTVMVAFLVTSAVLVVVNPPTPHLGHVRMFCHLGNCPSESKGWKFLHENTNVTKYKSGFRPVSAQNEGQHVANWAAQLLLWCICAVLSGFLSNDQNSMCVCVCNLYFGTKYPSGVKRLRSCNSVRRWL